MARKMFPGLSTFRKHGYETMFSGNSVNSWFVQLQETSPENKSLVKKKPNLK
jgi:hypothetical protein